ncbi:MAG: YicC family protein [Mangrovibacterium sp.]|nr:YicC family protein [Mangrovibacterium sp.]
MIKSMTGYGKAEFETGNKKITVELKSLNSKQIDINTRIPMSYREKELEIRKEISEKLVRGKIDFSIFVEDHGAESNSAINGPVVINYVNQLGEIQKKLGLPVTELIIAPVMRLPDSVKTVFASPDEKEWEAVFIQIQSVIQSVIQFRIQEGEALGRDITANLAEIQHLFKQIDPFEEQRMANIKARILESLNQINVNGSVDKNRFEQELIYYLEKLDINEEKVRLTNHCDYFLETLLGPGDSGKKLGFIAQEIGREINTIGSKANESHMQRIVVQMKDALERIKEQLLNVL